MRSILSLQKGMAIFAFATLLLVGLFSLPSIVYADHVENNPNDPHHNGNIRICHATGQSQAHEFISNEPNKSGDVNGHAGTHHQEGRDIIPPFEYWEHIESGRHNELVCPNNSYTFNPSTGLCQRSNGQTTQPQTVEVIDYTWALLNFPGQNWNQRGQGIWNNNCVIPAPTPEPTIEPTPIPPCQGDCPTPTPTPTPSPTDPKSSDVKTTALSCDNRNFDVIATLISEGLPASGVKINFAYHFVKHEAITDANGKAQVSFYYEGDESVLVQPDGGFPSHARHIELPNKQNCPTLEYGIGGGDFTEAQALAETGVITDLIAKSLGSLGGFLTMVGSALYAKKKS